MLQTRVTVQLERIEIRLRGRFLAVFQPEYDPGLGLDLQFAQLAMQTVNGPGNLADVTRQFPNGLLRSAVRDQQFTHQAQQAVERLTGYAQLLTDDRRILGFAGQRRVPPVRECAARGIEAPSRFGHRSCIFSDHWLRLVSGVPSRCAQTAAILIGPFGDRTLRPDGRYDFGCHTQLLEQVARQFDRQSFGPLIQLTLQGIQCLTKQRMRLTRHLLLHGPQAREITLDGMRQITQKQRTRHSGAALERMQSAHQGIDGDRAVSLRVNAKQIIDMGQQLGTFFKKERPNLRIGGLDAHLPLQPLPITPQALQPCHLD